MFNLHAVQAQFGDSLILEFGTAANRRFILVDGGPPDTFNNDLDAALQSIVQSGKLDAVILSHIDNDHIVGLLDLLAALEEDKANGKPPRVAIAGNWHNSFQKALDPDGQITQRMQMLMSVAGTKNMAMPFAADAFFGVKEGNRLRILAKKLKLSLNKGFKDDLVMLETATQPSKFGKLTLRVVGPNQANLDALRDEWMDWLAKGREENGSIRRRRQMPIRASLTSAASFCWRSARKDYTANGSARSDHILDGLKQAAC